MESRKYTAYTDGSADNNFTKKGGAAFVIIQDDRVIHKDCERYENTTSNRVEMVAIINAVKYVPEGSEIEVFTDSQYSIKVFTGEWNPTTNHDLIDKYHQVSKNKKVTLSWIKSHSGNKYNEMADEMAHNLIKTKQ